MSTSALTRPTLVLNRNWQPVHVSTVARALIMVWNGSARVVDPHDYSQYDWADWSRLRPTQDDLFVQAVTTRLRVPEVVALTTFDRVPRGEVAFSRRNLCKRDGYTCQYCRVKMTGDELTIDHIIPRSRGGTSRWENCVLACVPCNKRKANRTPEEAHMRLLHKPVRPKWKPLYATSHVPIASWTKFISEAYWSVELDP